MSKQDNTQPNNQQSPIEDLIVNQDQAAEVKGGPVQAIVFQGDLYDPCLTDR